MRDYAPPVNSSEFLVVDFHFVFQVSISPKSVCFDSKPIKNHTLKPPADNVALRPTSLVSAKDLFGRH